MSRVATSTLERPETTRAAVKDHGPSMSENAMKGRERPPRVELECCVRVSCVRATGNVGRRVSSCAVRGRVASTLSSCTFKRPSPA